MIGISALTIIDKKGKSIVSKNYREDVPSNFLSIFNQKILEHDTEKSPPFLTVDDVSFFYVEFQDIRLLAVSKGNANTMMIFSFLKSFV